MALNTQQQGELVNALVSQGGYSQEDAQKAASGTGGRADDLYMVYMNQNAPQQIQSQNSPLPTIKTNRQIEPNRQYRAEELMGTDLEAEAWHKSGHEVNINGQIYKVVNNGNNTRSFIPAGSAMDRAVQQGTNAFNQQKNIIQQQTNVSQAGLREESRSLQDRYKSVIEEMKASTQQAIDRTSSTVRQELANRGINLQGNAAQQEVNANVNPLNEGLTRNLRDVGIAREQDLFKLAQMIAQLPLTAQQQMLALDQAIAQLSMQGAQFDQNAAIQMAQLELARQQEGRASQLQNLNISQAEQTFPLSLKMAQEELLSKQLANQKAQKSGNQSSLSGMTNNPYFVSGGMSTVDPWQAQMQQARQNTQNGDFSYINSSVLPYLKYSK